MNYCAATQTVNGTSEVSRPEGTMEHDTMKDKIDRTMAALRELNTAIYDMESVLFGATNGPAENREKLPEPDCMDAALRNIDQQTKIALQNFLIIRNRML